MSAVEYRFLEPLDVLFLRGNKLFGDPGSFGESLIPPWPSVAAGALRSRMLADDGVDLAAFARGEVRHSALGTPTEPGPFAVTGFNLARRLAGDAVEPLFAPPADLALSRDEAGMIQVRALNPTRLPTGEGRILSSAPLPQLPVFAETERSKPVTSYWLTATGWQKYLKGEMPSTGDFILSSALWSIDARVGVGLDAATRRAADGRLFTVQAVAMKKREHTPKDGFDAGFLLGVTGAKLPDSGTVRLGGDGRAAAIYSAAPNLTEPDYEAIARNRRCRLVLSTPGIFPAGWLPTGITQIESGGFRFDLDGVKGRLVCAAVPRSETVSGWDLANWRPKPAQRAVPTGSVYWIDGLEATPDALRKLAAQGFWSDPCHDPLRRAEGFNRVAVAAWRSA